MKIEFELNKKLVSIEVKPDERAVDLLRECFNMTGVKEGCGAGECGACAILVDGESRLSCMMMSCQLNGRKVTTIEGVADGTNLHTIQKAFIEHGAVQCGFCTPGMIISAIDLTNRNPNPTRDDVRIGISGNLCRCTGYHKIIDAVVNRSS